jgi:hypothetical protein
MCLYIYIYIYIYISCCLDQSHDYFTSAMLEFLLNIYRNYKCLQRVIWRIHNTQYTNNVLYIFPYILEFLRSSLHTFPNVHTEKPKEVTRRYTSYTIMNKMKFSIHLEAFKY